MSLRADTNIKVRELLDELAEKVHPWERSHAERVQVYAVATGAELGLGEEELDELKVAAALHDIGKLEEPAGPWSEPGRALLEGESEQVRMHPSKGSDRLKREGFSSAVVEMVADHHERLDGSGYPHDKEGEEISTGARIIGLAEYFDGVAFGPWSKKGPDEARKWVMAAWPGLWGEDVVRAFLKVERLIQPLED